ncbi:hypothetical protein N7523_000771 [Penicillium sp. IBT 18751x]|nr:hypothetical protein N7523_000771 [Penicillium sp. IBT 18751x]
MYFTSFITAIAVLAVSAKAAPAPAAYTRYAQLRVYGEPGCFAQNLGELGIYDINQCKSFGHTDMIKSISFEVNTPGCTLHVWNDVTCQLNDHVMSTTGTCLAGDKSYGSYELRCDF